MDPISSLVNEYNQSVKSGNYGVAKLNQNIDTSGAPTQASTKARQPGNFFTRSLPTIGGIIGGTIGLPLNALDLISGPIGTAGDVGLAAGTASLGKLLENRLEGNTQKLTSQIPGAAVQGVEGGIAQLTGEKLIAPALQAGRGLLAAGASRVGADVLNQSVGDLIGKGTAAAASQAATGGITADETANAAARGGGKLQNFYDTAATKKAAQEYANTIDQHYGDIPAAKRTGLQDVLGELQRHGISPTPTNMNAYGNAGYAYNDVLSTLAGNAKPIPAAELGINNIVDSAVAKQPGLGANSDAIAKNLKDILGRALAPEGNITGQYAPKDVFAATKALFDATPENAMQAKVFADVRSQLINALGDKAGINDMLAKGIAPDASGAIAKGEAKIPNVVDAVKTMQTPGIDLKDPQALAAAQQSVYFLEKAGGNQTLAQEMIDTVNKASTVQEIQQAELKHISANNIANAGVRASSAALPEVASTATERNLQNIGLLGGGSPNARGGFYAAREVGNLPKNPLMGVPLAAMAGLGEKISDVAAARGVADLSQVGPGVAQEILPGATEAMAGVQLPGAAADLTPTPPVGAPAEAPAPAPSGRISGLIGKLTGKLPNIPEAPPIIRAPAGAGFQGLLHANQEASTQAQFQHGAQAAGTTDFTQPSPAIQTLAQQSQIDPRDNPTGYSVEEIQQLIANDVAKTGGKNYTQLSHLLAVAKADTPPKLSATAVSKLGEYQSQLGSLQEIYSAISGGGDYNSVNSIIQQNVPVIAKALGLSATNKQQAAVLQQLLPNPNDNPQVAEQKLQTIKATIDQQMEGVLNQDVKSSSAGDALSSLLGSAQQQPALAGAGQ